MPATLLETCERLSLAAPEDVPADPLERLKYFTKRDVDQEAALARCEDKRAALGAILKAMQ